VFVGSSPITFTSPSFDQIGAALLVGISTIGISFSIHARFADARTADIFTRVVLAAFALLALFVHDYSIASAACVPVLSVIGYWLIHRRKTEAGEPQVVELVEAKAPIVLPETDCVAGVVRLELGNV
jgi:hypothetical protein